MKRMNTLFQIIKPTAKEIALLLPGDSILPKPNIIMDRAFTLPAKSDVVWSWFRQLGKNQAGWYFPHLIEHFIPKKRRGLYTIDTAIKQPKVGERIDDWGGKDGYLEVAILEPPHTLVYVSTRGKFSMSWAITLWPAGDNTRVIIRLRMTSSSKLHFFQPIGELFDKLTIAGLAVGMRERLSK
jgi:hypothetical protein